MSQIISHYKGEGFSTIKIAATTRLSHVVFLCKSFIRDDSKELQPWKKRVGNRIGQREKVNCNIFLMEATVNATENSEAAEVFLVGLRRPVLSPLT